MQAPSTLLLCLGGTLHLQAHGQLCDRSSPSEWRMEGGCFAFSCSVFREAAKTCLEQVPDLGTLLGLRFIVIDHLVNCTRAFIFTTCLDITSLSTEFYNHTV